MAIRVKHKVAVAIGLASDMKNTLLELDDTLAEVILDGFDRAVSNIVAIAAAATEQLSLGDLSTVRGMYLEVDGDCTVRLNGSTDDILMKVGATGGKAKLLLEATITQVEIEATGAAVNGVYAMWGDPTP